MEYVVAILLTQILEVIFAYLTCEVFLVHLMSLCKFYILIVFVYVFKWLVCETIEICITMDNLDQVDLRYNIVSLHQFDQKGPCIG